MFLGTYTPRLDDKARLFLPAKFRDQLAEGLVVAKGQERCLAVYPLADFATLATRAQASPVMNKDARDYSRMLASGASDDNLDKQGRITIPGGLRDYAAIDRDVVVVGVFNRIEIWDPRKWESYNDEQQDRFSSITEDPFAGS